MSITAMKEMANYIDALGGDSKKYRQAIEQAEKQEHQINQLEKFKNHVLANADALGVVLDAPAAPVQEPVAFVTGTYAGRFIVEPLNRAMVLPEGMALYSAPQPQRCINCKSLEQQNTWLDQKLAEFEKRQWVGLTDEERWAFWWNRPEIPDSEDDNTEEKFVAEFVAVVRAIEAKLKEKNT